MGPAAKPGESLAAMTRFLAFVLGLAIPLAAAGWGAG